MIEARAKRVGDSPEAFEVPRRGRTSAAGASPGFCCVGSITEPPSTHSQYRPSRALASRTSTSSMETEMQGQGIRCGGPRVPALTEGRDMV